MDLIIFIDFSVTLYFNYSFLIILMKTFPLFSLKMFKFILNIYFVS